MVRKRRWKEKRMGKRKWINKTKITS